MSRTRKGSKPPGYEFWSRRPGPLHYGPVAKWITKRRERARDRRMEHRVTIDPWDFEGRFPGE